MTPPSEITRIPFGDLIPRNGSDDNRDVKGETILSKFGGPSFLELLAVVVLVGDESIHGEIENNFDEVKNLDELAVSGGGRGSGRYGNGLVDCGVICKGMADDWGHGGKETGCDDGFLAEFLRNPSVRYEITNIEES